MTTGVGGCRGGCGNAAIAVVPARAVLETRSLTPRQAAEVARQNGTYGDWVTDVPVQGPTDPGIRAAGCWWKENVVDQVTDRQGAIVPRWTQSSALCVNGRPCLTAGVGEAVSRGGRRVALGDGPPSATPATVPAPAPGAAPTASPAAPPPPGVWSKLTDAESHWVAATLIQLNTLIIKAGNKPCVTWPADLLASDASAVAKMPAAVACFQGWFNSNVHPNRALRTDGVLDEKTVCALVVVTGQHAQDFPTPYPGVLKCGGLSTLAKVGIGAGVVAVVGGTIAAISMRGKKRGSTQPTVSEARTKRGRFAGKPTPAPNPGMRD
jgi:hypothetical protein